MLRAGVLVFCIVVVVILFKINRISQYNCIVLISFIVDFCLLLGPTLQQLLQNAELLLLALCFSTCTVL